MNRYINLKIEWTKIIPILVTVFVCEFAMAGDVYYGSEPEIVKVKYGHSTLFRFPSEVRTISQASRFEIKPANEGDPDYSVLSVKPRFSKGTNNVVFMLGDGSIVRARIVVTTKRLRGIDGIYDFKPKSELIDEMKNKKSGPPISAFELLKAMVRDDIVSGYKRMVLNRSVSSGMKGVKASLVRAYRGEKFSGFVFQLKNVTYTKTYEIDVRKLAMGSPNVAIVSQVDLSSLAPTKKKGNQTFLRIVAKTSGDSAEVKLPISMRKEKK